MAERIPINGEARHNRVKNWNGIKTFAGGPMPSRDHFLAQIAAITADQLREEKKVWRPEETIEASQIFFSQGKINVVGPPQSGKGTILFGLSEMCDLMGVGYIFISGHHQETTGQEIADTIRTAERKKMPVFYDSADYLFLKSRAVGREVNLREQKAKASWVMPYLTAAAVPVAITSHDEQWDGEFLNLELRSQYQSLLDLFPRYKIPLYLQSETSILRFLKDHDIPPAIGQYLVTMEANQIIIDNLQLRFGKEPTRQIFSAVRTYPVLKELARERTKDLLTIMDKLAYQPDALGKLGYLILEIDNQCRQLTQLRKSKKTKK